MSDPGTGKTRGHLELYAERKDRKRLLVVCPKTLMMSAWGNDIEQFVSTLTYSLAYAECRKEAFAMKTDVVIMNTDGVKWLVDQPKSLLEQFDHLIIDEGTSFKHRTSQRSKSMLKLRKYFKYRYLLTATPNAKSVTELWHPMMIVDDGRRLGTSFVHFRNTVQSPTQVGPKENHLRWDDRPGAQQAVTELLSDITVRHQFEDVMKHVPPNHKNTKTFSLTPKAKKIYDRLENDCAIAFKESTVTAVHAASLRSKLLQVASGAVYSEGDQYEVIDRQRYELVADLVEECKHSVVFFNWRHQRAELAKEFTSRDITYAVIDGSTPDRDRSVIVDDYQAGKYRAILLHPRTGAHGLTLTRGETTIFTSPIYEADLMKQAIHRTYRGSQDHVTNTIFVQANDTVEGGVYERLNDRYAKMVELLDLLKMRGKV